MTGAAINSPFAEYGLTGQAVNSTITTEADALAFAGITSRPHVFFGVTFTDNNGAAATPGAGTYTITVETANNPGVFQSIQNGTTVDATAALETLSCAAHITRAKLVTDSITTATKVNFKITASAT